MAKAKKLPSGAWRCKAYYTDEEGNYTSKSFTADTKKEAEAKAATYLMEREHNAKPENKTLGELADTFIENRSNVLSPSTIRGYQKIRRTALQSIVNVRLANLTREMYQKAINDYSKGRSPKTVLSAHVFFNKILKENKVYVGDGVILPQKKKTEVEIPTTAEIQHLLKEARNTRLYLYCLFSICLGLRKSETIAIQWKDIDLKKRTVNINKARVKDEIGEYVVKQTKTYSGERTLHLPQVLVDALGDAGKPDDYIIDDSPDALESLYKRFAVKIDFPYNFHALRHYYASVMLQSGIPNRYAKERMGHATENMLVNVYQHTFKSKQEEFDAVLDTFLDSVLEGVGKE